MKGKVGVMRKRFWLAGVLVLLAAVVQAEELAIAGAWTNATGVLRFFGRGIGQEALPTARCFQYQFPAEDQITLNYGGGVAEQFTISVVNDELHLVDTNQQEKVYTRVDLGLTACVLNLNQLAGAMALFSLDHDGLPASNPMELVPNYLPELPLCPDGGIYSLSSPSGLPTCTIPEHIVEP